MAESCISRYELRLFVQLLIVSVLNLFLCLSVMVICTAAFTENVGYVAVVYDSEGQEVERYEYYYADGEDARAALYSEDDGYQISEQTLKSSLSAVGSAVFRTVTQLFTFLMLLGFVYPRMWQLGAKDSNLVRFKHRASDPLRGLKIGVLAQIPGVLTLLAFFIFGRNLRVSVYALLNSTYYGLIAWIGGNRTFAQLGFFPTAALFLLLSIAPAVAEGAYLLGLKDISLSERLIYSKKDKNVKQR